MNSIWPSHRPAAFESAERIDSKTHPGVRFWIRKVSLSQRIGLLERLRQAGRDSEYLKAGDAGENLLEALNSARAARLLIEWGLERVEGLTIDGQPATPELLVERGSEDMCGEIAEALQRTLGLTEQERKNS